MKKLVIIVLLSLTLGLAVHQSAKSDYSLTYPDSSQAMVWLYSGGRLAFIFTDWAGDWDWFTTHSFTNATPALVDLGAGSYLGHWLDYQYSSGGHLYVNVYVTTNNVNWFFVGLYFI